MSDLILAHAAPLSEFQTDPVTKVLYNGTCGQTALEEALGIAQGRTPTGFGICALTRDMAHHGWLTAPNGAATLNALANEAKAQGITPLLEVDFDTPPMATWRSTLLKHAGHNPVVVQVKNGQALKDQRHGDTDEIGLHYHAFCVVGLGGEGELICVDGDQPHAATQFAYYTLETITQAEPCALLVIPAHHDPSPEWRDIGDGWMDNGKEMLSAPAPVGEKKAFLIDPHFRDMLLPDMLRRNAMHSHLGPAIAESEAVEDVGLDGLGPGVRQLFLYGALGWTPKNGVMRLWTGVLWARAAHLLTI